MSAHYFYSTCPSCEHTLRLSYAYDPEEGPHSLAIVDAGACNCLLGEDWLEDALSDYLDGRYIPALEDFLP